MPDLFDNLPQQWPPTVTRELVYHYEVAGKVLFSAVGDAEDILWLPAGEIAIAPTGERTSDAKRPRFAICAVTLPLALAREAKLK